jgi:hypothetical protein
MLPFLNTVCALIVLGCWIINKPYAVLRKNEYKRVFFREIIITFNPYEYKTDMSINIFYFFNALETSVGFSLKTFDLFFL